MKKTSLRQAAMKLALVACVLLAPLGLRAQTLTVFEGDGTVTNRFVPIDGYNVDGTSIKSEYIMPAGDLAAMNGKDITGMTLYLQTVGNQSWGSATFRVFMKEVATTTISSFTGYNDATVVYLGALDCQQEEMEISFTESYSYHGGNLLIGIYIVSSGSYTGSYNSYKPLYYGEEVTGASIGGTSASQQNFLPKTTFTYETPAATPKPTGFAVSNILHNQADLSWNENGTATSWQICVNDDEENLITATTNPYTLTGLTPLTAYTVKVRSVGSPNSDWSTARSFSTTAQATVVGDSWSDDFEGGSCGWELVNGTLTNKWCWGTAVNNGGTHSLYISNDDGTSNAYSGGGTMVYATKLLSFAETKYEFSYNWRAKGESCCDYLRVALVPASVTLAAATVYPSGFGTSTLPSGWIALDGGSKLGLEGTTWQSKNVTINVSAGNYYLVFAWRNDSDGGGSCDPPAAVDNVSITRVACPYDVAGLAVANDPAVTQTTATVTWTAGEASQWQVATKTGDADWVILPSIYNTNSAALTGLTAATTYQVKVRAYCNATDQGTWCDPIPLTTACPEYAEVPFTENFDGYTITSVYTPSSRTLPICWSFINTSTYSTNKWYPTMHYYSYTDYSNSSPNYIRFYIDAYSGSNYDPQDQYLILPAVQDVDGLRIKLQARVYSTGSTYDATFKVGIMSDPADAGTFEEIAEKTPTTESYEQYIIPFNGYTGSGNHIAIKVEAPETPAATYTHAYRAVCIDDITVEEIPNCLEPSDLQFVSSTTTTATLSWTKNGDETHWDIYYSTENVAPANNTHPSADANTNTNATIEGLTASTIYYVWVRAHCGDGDGQQSPWMGGISFATECEAIASFPWSENFESFAANTVPLCWDNSATTGTDYGSHPEYYWGVYEYGGNKMIRMYNFYAHGPLAIINTPTIDLPAEPKELTFFYTHTASSGDFTVKISEDNGLSFVDLQSYSKGDGSSNSDPGTFTEATISLADYINKSVIIQFYSAANYGSGAIFIDNIRIDNIPTCKKTSNLTVDNSATTAHTATLSWTKGSNDQDAWQIAYSTSNSFAPAANFTPGDGEGLVAADNNTSFEVTGLAQSTTYYAYVRANCGGGDYSAWNNTRISFTTLAGNVTPTGLAKDNASITSSQAKMTWNAVAGNTLHEYYELYYSGLNTMDPNNLDLDSLISNITTTYHTFTGLAAEKTYYVWVRDYCGDDGYSAWSSPVSFATAAACQTPDGLAASNVTNNSATISWNAYGQTGFNLRYSTDGENWTPVNDINTPYTLDGVLTGNTAYQVQVQATCNTEAWSTVLNFRTKCDARDDFPISYGFETSEGFPSNAGTPTTNQLGNCWRNEATLQNGSNATRVWGTSTSYKHDGSQALILPDKGNSTNFAKTMLAFPAMNFTSANGYKVSFWINRSATSSNPEGFKVYASHTDTIDGSAVLLGHYSRNYTIAYPQIEAASGWYQYDIYIPQATMTGTVYLIFEGQSYYGNATYVDDITIDEAPSCYPVGTLADAANVEARSARLSWTLVDNNQDNWEVQYATNDAFTEGVQTVADVNVHTNYTLSNLTPETHYYVRVRANCGGGDYSEWSNTINFTTEPTCYPVGTLTYANEGTHSAELSWVLVDDNQDNWDVQYATDDAFSEGVQTVADVDVNTDYTLSGLTPETHYWVRVRANCGNVDGYGAWSNVVDFTTGIACPAPTALTLDASTTETLTISWTGSADTWIVAYKEAESLGDFTIATEDATNPYTITGLTDGTLYTVRVRANCGNVNGLSQWLAEDFQTEASCPSPYDLAVTDASETAHGATITWNGNVDNDSYTVEYAEGPLNGLATLLNEGFEGGSMPDGWSRTGSYWNVGSGTGHYSYLGAATGDYNATCYISTGSSTSDMLITPAIDLSGKESATLSFNYRNKAWGSDINQFHVYYRVDGGEWQELYENLAEQASWTATPISIVLPNLAANYQIGFKCTTGSTSSAYGYGMGIDDVKITATYTPSYSWNTLDNDATSPYEITTLDPETQYVVRVKGVCGSTPSPASNIVGFTTLEACGAPTAFILGAVEAHQATFSWTAGIANTAWKVYVKEHGAAEYPVAYTNANTTSVTIDGLEDNTAYDVKIVPTCNESKILEVENAFTTPCEATVVDADHPFTESFDVNTFPPSDCWDTIKAGTHTWSRATNQHHTGEASAYSGYYGDIYLILPDLAIADESADVLLKFWSYNTFTSSYDKNSVVLLEGNNETELWTTAEVSQQWVESTVDLSVYKGQTVSIAFKYEGNNAHGWYIDDVTVGFFHTINATASPVAGGTVTGGNTYLHGASVTLTATPNAGYQFVNWTKGGVEQSTNTSYSFTASEDADYVANFANVYTKTITANKWYAISSPVHNSGDDETLAGVTNLTSGTYDLFGFTESAGTWNKPTTVLEQGKGYIYRAAADVTLSFVGTPNSGDISYDLSYACSSDNDIKGFNLVGNPYPQAATPGMACYSLTAAGTWLAQLASYSVPACEAVLVKTNGTGNHVSFNTGGGAKGLTSTRTLAFTVSNDEFEDVTYAILEDGDNLPKIGHLEPNAPELSIPVAGHSYAIATLGAETESFDLVFRGTGEYTLTLNSQLSTLNYCHLIDRVAGKDIDLLSQPSYTFSTSANDAGRFLVKLSASLDNVNGEVAFWNGTSWTVTGEGTLEIYDALGRQLFRHDVNSELRILNSEFPSAGVYVLRLGGNSQKIVVTK